MIQRLALFVALVLGLMACKSSGPHDSNSSSTSDLSMTVDFNEPQTYAQLADERIHESFRALWQDLETLNERKDLRLPSTESQSLERNLIAFEDMLEIFVHVLPTQDDEDPFLELYAGLEEGRVLLGQVRSPGMDPAALEDLQKGILDWSQRMTTIPLRNRYENYLATLNQNKATRRTIPVLENYCWGHVDYIPQLRGPAVFELQAFMKALLNATRSIATEARGIDDILPVDQRRAFHATRKKSRSILAINQYFATVFEDENRVQKALPVLKAFSERYESFNGLLFAYDKMKNKKTQDALALAKVITEEWGALRNLSSTLQSI